MTFSGEFFNYKMHFFRKKWEGNNDISILLYKYN